MKHRPATTANLTNPMRYPGGKNAPGTYHKLINQVPPHHTRIDACMGSGALLRLMRPAALNIGIDPDRRAIQMVRAATAMMPVEYPGSRFRFVCADALAWLRSYKWRGGEFVYFDPPYLMETRASSRPIYRFEWTDEQHRDFLKLITGELPAGVNVMVSGYHSDLYAEALATWRRFEFEAMTRAGSTATEVVWCNYPEPFELHDYRFLGSDYRKREDLKRKKLRWVARLRRMSPLERGALLDAIAQVRATAEHR